MSAPRKGGVFDCGCSAFKVAEGLCDVYAPDGSLRPARERGRGLSSVSPERRREIAGAGGRAAHAAGRAHEFSPEEARVAGKKGGAVIASRGREYMAAIGRLGGKARARKVGAA